MKDTDKQEILEAIGSIAGQTHELKKDTQELKEGRNEILEAIQAFAEQVDSRFNNIESEMGSMKIDIGTLKSDVGTLKSRVTSIESQMVTKDYLDNKLADLRSDLIVLTRKENTKLSVLVEELVVTKSLSRKSADRILLMEPFSQEKKERA